MSRHRSLDEVLADHLNKWQNWNTTAQSIWMTGYASSRSRLGRQHNAESAAIHSAQPMSPSSGFASRWTYSRESAERADASYVLGGERVRVVNRGGLLTVTPPTMPIVGPFPLGPGDVATSLSRLMHCLRPHQIGSEMNHRGRRGFSVVLQRIDQDHRTACGEFLTALGDTAVRYRIVIDESLGILLRGEAFLEGNQLLQRFVVDHVQHDDS